MNSDQLSEFQRSAVACAPIGKREGWNGPTDAGNGRVRLTHSTGATVEGCEGGGYCVVMAGKVVLETPQNIMREKAGSAAGRCAKYVEDADAAHKAAIAEAAKMQAEKAAAAEKPKEPEPVKKRGK
jgi:hypothetical protein